MSGIFVAFAAWLLMASPASAQKRPVALVIGNPAYVQEARLTNPLDDAKGGATPSRH